MTAFFSSVDIANRALQHCGATRIDATLGFAEQSKNASEIAFCYDKLRRAELRRNTWTFATRRTVLRAIDVNTRILSPALWSQTTTYFIGSIVADQFGTPWVSKIPSNIGNDPLNSAGAWQQYFGPMTADLFDPTQGYFAGELVYTTAGDGTYRVYLSLISANADVPATATAYDPTATYVKNQVVTYLSVAYMSLIDFNIAQTPTASAAPWAVGTTYASGNSVTGSDGIKYTSLVNGNVGIDPTTDPGTHWQNTGILTPWTTSFIGGSGSLNWLEIGGAEFPSGVALSQMPIIYPIGTGPSSQSDSRNVFKLPASYLRTAPQDQKAGSNSYLGAPSGLVYDDWEYESGFIVSNLDGPIVLRFVSDMSDVTLMDDMFCEGLAARIGLEVCEVITQSTDKVKTIAAIYKQTMGEARTVNAIEAGSEEPPQDDWVSCRV